MKREAKLILAAACFLALSYIAVFYYADSRQGPVARASCQRSADGFVLQFPRAQGGNRKLNVLNLRPGRISVKVRPRLEDMEFVTADNRIVRVGKVNDNLFQLTLGMNLVVRSLRLRPISSSISRIDVQISRKPVFSPGFALFQFTFLFLLAVLFLSAAFFLFSLVAGGGRLQGLAPGMLPAPLLALFLAVLLFIVLHPGAFLERFFPGGSPASVLNVLAFNGALALSLLALFFLFSGRSRGERLPFYLPLLFALPVWFVRIPFSIKASADSLLWVLNLTFQKTEISFAEALSLLLNKLTFFLFNLGARTKAAASLMTTGKLIGILFLFSLYLLINSFADLSYRKKLLFFLLFSIMPFSVLLFGFPEFRYYALPFLIFSFLFAKKYVGNDGGNIASLAAATVFAALAGLFHGTAYFSSPVILLLPLLKKKAAGTGIIAFHLRHYAAIVLAAGLVFASFLALVRLLGFDLLFNTVAGGFDGRQFIPFLPLDIHFPEAVNFLETGYFFSRGWMLLSTGAFVFLLFPGLWRGRAAMGTADIVLFLFGLSQLLIVFFWGFDNGVSEFDLYIAPPTMMYLFLIRCLAAELPDEKRGWKYIAVFSLFSPLLPLLLKMIER
jgi:hypothetical protein